jgi:hypothetical protein
VEQQDGQRERERNRDKKTRRSGQLKSSNFFFERVENVKAGTEWP